MRDLVYISAKGDKLDFSEHLSALCKKSKLKVTCSSENLELYEYTET